MPWVNNPRYGEPGEYREIWQHDKTTEAVDPGTARVIVALVGLCLVPWLYPLLTVVLASVGGGAAFLAREALDVRGLPQFAVSAVPVIVVLVLLMRVEQRLGTIAPYRWARSALRVMMPVALLYVIIAGDSNSTEPSLNGFIAAVSNDSSIRGGAVFVALIAAAVLYFARYLRDDWHASLIRMRMRAPGLG